MLTRIEINKESFTQVPVFDFRLCAKRMEESCLQTKQFYLFYLTGKL